MIEGMIKTFNAATEASFGVMCPDPAMLEALKDDCIGQSAITNAIETSKAMLGMTETGLQMAEFLPGMDKMKDAIDLAKTMTKTAKEVLDKSADVLEENACANCEAMHKFFDDVVKMTKGEVDKLDNLPFGGVVKGMIQTFNKGAEMLFQALCPVYRAKLMDDDCLGKDLVDGAIDATKMALNVAKTGLSMAENMPGIEDAVKMG